MTDSTQLPFASANDWHWRWVQRPAARAITLHRVKSYRARDDDWVRLYGVLTVCGRAFKSTPMPGFCSRTGAPRCRRCCRRVGIPEGLGNPYNHGITEPGCEGPAPCGARP